MLARFRPLIVAVAVATTLLAPHVSAAANKASASAKVENSNSLLWKIEKKGTPNSWLYGTAHVGDPRVTQLSPKTEAAFSDAKHVVTEIRLDFGMMMEMGKRMLTPEPSLAQKIDTEHYQKLLPALEARGYPEVATAKLKPWGAAMLLMTPVRQSGQMPLDLLFAKMAIEGQKEYTGLETLDEQLSLFENIPEAKQIELLYTVLDQQEAMQQSYQQILDLYLKQDINGLAAFAEQDDIKMADQAWYKQWRFQLLEARNPRMAERLADKLKDGNAFIAVGALHLPGKMGLIQSLRQQGYRVSPVK
ncbi:TraB/GumN family protein [Iodobacter sp. CM08]|uniref:TraB/GumN family protein n=1 Tax=Iodobacter sp. CM08 TaxID=3085902 RepID=UPI002981AE78|nr:TraB/GumN family protein [Iodobacter sp. CM08]MDW5416058.1 TraB/GumN family protein [Iodobacter sp. CM08]